MHPDEQCLALRISQAGQVSKFHHQGLYFAGVPLFHLELFGGGKFLGHLIERIFIQGSQLRRYLIGKPQYNRTLAANVHRFITAGDIIELVARQQAMQCGNFGGIDATALDAAPFIHRPQRLADVGHFFVFSCDDVGKYSQSNSPISPVFAGTRTDHIGKSILLPILTSQPVLPGPDYRLLPQTQRLTCQAIRLPIAVARQPMQHNLVEGGNQRPRLPDQCMKADELGSLPAVDVPNDEIAVAMHDQLSRPGLSSQFQHGAKRPQLGFVVAAAASQPGDFAMFAVR